MTEPHEKRDPASAALSELLQQAQLQQVSGTGYVRIDFNEGRIVNVRKSLEEKYRLKS